MDRNRLRGSTLLPGFRVSRAAAAHATLPGHGGPRRPTTTGAEGGEDRALGSASEPSLHHPRGGWVIPGGGRPAMLGLIEHLRAYQPAVAVATAHFCTSRRTLRRSLPIHLPRRSQVRRAASHSPPGGKNSPRRPLWRSLSSGNPTATQCGPGCDRCSAEYGLSVQQPRGESRSEGRDTEWESDGGERTPTRGGTEGGQQEQRSGASASMRPSDGDFPGGPRTRAGAPFAP